jgi:hypothetical protein
MKKEPQVPQGTIALMVIFAFFLVLFWANAYFTVLSRGATTQ